MLLHRTDYAAESSATSAKSFMEIIRSTCIRYTGARFSNFNFDEKKMEKNL